MAQEKKEDIDLEISRRVKEIRTAQGLTYRALAQRANDLGHRMTFARASELEKGRQNWGWKSICIIAAALDVSPGELIEGSSKIIQDNDEQALIDSWRIAGAVGVLGWLARNFPTE